MIQIQKTNPMKQIIFFLFAVLYLSACSPPKKNLTSLILDVDNFTDAQNSFSSIEFIPLETNDSCLLSDITKIIYKDSLYYISDATSSCIFIFSETGKFVKSIRRIGEGPGEYLSISDFDIDNEKNIYINSAVNRKLIKYLYPDYWKTEDDLVKKSFWGLATDPKINGIWQSSIVNDNVRYKQLAFYTNGEATIKLEDRAVFDDFARVSKPLCFYKSNEYLFFNPNYSPYIYQLENGVISTIAEIKSERFITPEDLNFDINDSDDRQEFYAKKHIEGVDFFCKIGDYYMGALRGFGGRFFVYDIVQKTGAFMATDPFETYSVLTQSKDAIVGVTSLEKYRQTYPEQAEKVNEDDNPILVKVKL